MLIKAVVWDVDDTLFDYAGADTAGMRAHLAAEGLLERYASVDDALALWRALTVRHWTRCAAGQVDFLGQRRDRVREFLTAAVPDGAAPPPAAPRSAAPPPAVPVGTGADGAAPVGTGPLGVGSDAEADAWFGRYLVHFEAAWALFPDTLPVLDALRTTHRHAVLSNAVVETQERKLRALGVRDRFEALLCADAIGVAKPHPRAFLAACDALGLVPSEVAYVGDQPDMDARGARDAGLLGIWLDRHGDARAVPAGVHRITCLDELPALLAGDTRFGAPTSFG